MPRTLAAIFAHPDDETFTIGGTVWCLANAGVDCHLWCATDGSAGRASGVPVASRDELGALRRNELISAGRTLGFREIRFGGYQDGALADTDGDRLVGDMVAFLRAMRPDIVVTFGPEGAPNAHADHRALSRTATAAYFLAGNPTAYAEQLDDGMTAHAAQRLYYCTWPPPPPDAELPTHGLPITASIDVRDCRSRKRSAFLTHATQRDHLARFETLAMGEEEHYALASGVPQPAVVIDDLFAGLEVPAYRR